MKAIRRGMACAVELPTGEIEKGHSRQSAACNATGVAVKCSHITSAEGLGLRVSPIRQDFEVSQAAR